MRKAKSGFASVFIQSKASKSGKLMIIGGNDGSVQNRVEFFSMSDLQWHKCSSMICKRDELAAVVGSDNLVYAIGGYGGSQNTSCLSSVERFDPATNTWEQVASMNEGRRALAAVSLPDGIYAIGGYNGKDYISSIERYDILRNEWRIVCHLNSAKCTMSAVPSPDFQSILIIGGFNGVQLNEVERCDIATKTCVLFDPPMSQRRFMHSSVMTLE